MRTYTYKNAMQSSSLRTHKFDVYCNVLYVTHIKFICVLNFVVNRLAANLTSRPPVVVRYEARRNDAYLTTTVTILPTCPNISVN